MKPYAFRFEDDWPIPRTEWTKMYLRIDRPGTENPKASEGELVKENPKTVAKVTYPGAARTRPGKNPRGGTTLGAQRFHLKGNLGRAANRQDGFVFGFSHAPKMNQPARPRIQTGAQSVIGVCLTGTP